MRLHKKGDGLSLNVIILAVLALLILVILSVIVLRGTGNFSKGVNACDSCVYDKSQCGTGYVPVPSSCTVDSSGAKGNYCCTNVDAPSTN